MSLEDLRTHPLPLARHAYWAARALGNVVEVNHRSEFKKIIWTASQDAILIEERNRGKRYLNEAARRTGRSRYACHARVKVLVKHGLAKTFSQLSTDAGV